MGNAGGKILLLERGAFEGMHAAMMVHPGPFDMLRPMFVITCSRKHFVKRLKLLSGQLRLSPCMSR